MADLIDRQAAIDALWKVKDERDSVYYTSAIHTAVETLEQLPPAQPEKRTETHACDLIDRQALMKEFSDFVRASNNSDFARTPIWNDAVSLVESMPSAQPERKKPVFKTGESVYHVSYADGTGGFEKNKWADWTCPDCGWFVGEQYIPRRHNQQKCNYCARCGCAIDWSDADMRGEQDE